MSTKLTAFNENNGKIFFAAIDRCACIMVKSAKNLYTDTAMRRDLIRKFVKYASLNMLGMIGLSLYILADTYFVSAKMGSDGLAALNIAIPAYSVINACGLMLGTGGATKYAVLHTQNDARKEGIFTHTLITGIGLGLLFALAGLFFSAPIASALGANGEIIGLTDEYLRTLMLMSPFFICNGLLNAYVRNDGSPNLSMAAMLIGSISNIFLDYLFMYPLNMGMFGAALATGCAPILGLLTLSLHFVRRRNTFGIRFRRGYIENVGNAVKLGVPSFINEISSGIVLLVFNYIILGISGNTGVAAYGVVANISLVCVAVFTGLAQGMQPLVSSSYAMGDEKGVRTLHRCSLLTAAALGAVFIAICCALAPQLTAVFNSENDPLLAELAERGLRLYCAGFLFAGLNIVSAMYFTARERAAQAFTIALTRGFGAIIAFSFLFSFLWEMTGVWLAFPAAEALTLALTAAFTIRLHKKRREGPDHSRSPSL